MIINDLQPHLFTCLYYTRCNEHRLVRIMALPAGKLEHIEAEIAYGMGKKCYTIGEFDATDSLYNIIAPIFEDERELEEFLKQYIS